MKARRALSAALLAGCLAAVGCGDGGGAGKGGDGKGEASRKSRRIGIAFASLSDPFSQAFRKGAEAVIKSHGDEAVVVDAKHEAPEQLKGVQKLVQAGVACILLEPVAADAAAAAVAKANAAKIPVLTFGVAAAEGKVASFIDSSHALAGELCADYIGWRLKARGRIVVLDHPGDASATPRIAGFRDRLATAFPNIEVAHTQAGQGRKDAAKAAVEKILQADPDVDAIFAINDASALGAAQALKAAKNAKAFVVGIGGTPEAIAELKEEASPFAMTVAQFPQQAGRVAAEVVYKLLAGEKVGERIRTPVMAVTKDNVGQHPGWEGSAPAAIEIPWPTDIRVAEDAE